MASLDEVIKNINKKYGANIVGSLEQTQRHYKAISFPTPSLTYLFRNNCPRTIIELLGENHCSKTTLATALCANAQKELKQEWQDEIDTLQSLDKPKASDKERLDYLLQRGPQKACYIDHEFSQDPVWMEKLGVDLSELIFIQPDGQTAEQVFQMILDLVASDGIGCMVLDSIPALVSQQAMDKTMEEKTFCGISASLSQFCSKFMPLQRKHGCLFIGINSTRCDISGYNRVISPGGKFFRNACSIRLLMKRGGYYDEKYADLKAHPDTASGVYIEVEVLKNKVSRGDRRMCKFSLTFSKGIDSFFDTVNLSIALGLITKAGAWFSIIDDDGNLLTDSEGNNMKWQGLKNVIAYFESHEVEFKELAKAVDEAITAED